MSNNETSSISDGSASSRPSSASYFHTYNSDSASDRDGSSSSSPSLPTSSSAYSFSRASGAYSSSSDSKRDSFALPNPVHHSARQNEASLPSSSLSSSVQPTRPAASTRYSSSNSSEHRIDIGKLSLLSSSNPSSAALSRPVTSSLTTSTLSSPSSPTSSTSSRPYSFHHSSTAFATTTLPSSNHSSASVSSSLPSSRAPPSSSRASSSSASSKMPPRLQPDDDKDESKSSNQHSNSSTAAAADTDEEPVIDRANILRAFARPLQYRQQHTHGVRKKKPLPMRLLMPNKTIKLGLVPERIEGESSNSNLASELGGRGVNGGGGGGGNNNRSSNNRSSNNLGARAQQQAAREAAMNDENMDLSELVIFSRLPEDELGRVTRLYVAILITLIICDLLTVLILLFRGMNNNSWISEIQPSAIVYFAFNFSLLLFGVMYVNAILSFLQVLSLFALTHVCFTLGLGYFSGRLRSVMVSTWFSPVV